MIEKIIKDPLIIRGKIMHNRFYPKKNYFSYNSIYICFPISKIENLKKTLFSLNRFNLFSFYNIDYGAKNKQNIKNWIYKILKDNNINNITEIVLVTHPRVLGYVFNPVSFWLCFDHKNNLIAVLNEVSNTCRQKHSYLCFKNNHELIKSEEWLKAKKKFYVSPFMEIEGEYNFRFDFINNVSFFINYLVDDKLKLSTSLKCDFQKFNNRNLFLNFIKFPFFTLKTIFLIHYQALKLYFKSIEYYKCPEKLKDNITISDEKK